MIIQDFLQLIRVSGQQKTFFHFTETTNIPSIRQNGLLSMREIRRRGLAHTAGGNQLSQDLDQRLGMDAYVHLCFRNQHGMAHQMAQDARITSISWLRISPDVLLIPGILMTLDNSVKNNVPALPLQDAIQQADTEVLYTRTNWSDPAIRARLKAAERYELLIPTSVPPNYII